MNENNGLSKVTKRSIIEMKGKGRKIACLTAYDFLFASLFDAADIDLLLVGDSVSMVYQGNETTLPVTVDELIYHAKSVVKGVSRSMVIVDMPFMSYQVSVEEAFRNAGRIMKETLAGGIKIEGGVRVAKAVEEISEAGIPVMGHLGLTPQSIHQFGGYKPRGVTPDEAAQIIKGAQALEKAGAFAIVLEKIPCELAKQITNMISIPTIGIGAGKHCDGQILVSHDMLGLLENFNPRFVRKYDQLASRIRDAATNYVKDVRGNNFPTDDESYT
ncbi:MAG: 3-methyl-2-oxobutanoate hydroxymethyltransferase [Planctomycetota bacterium]|nr:MAG: 3-methyl-2-oxobutanoate hydroxymethyltransferase [Planctomycetota bacterium]